MITTPTSMLGGIWCAFCKFCSCLRPSLGVGGMVWLDPVFRTASAAHMGPNVQASHMQASVQDVAHTTTWSSWLPPDGR
ncbi:hypothetical protein EJ03DRAFT_329777, partial [Teratosphaeria nubilosa]